MEEHSLQDDLSQIISWKATHHHDFSMGTHWNMLVDHPRNQFYDELLKECKDKVVIDVGFGAGILSMLALKHGAKIVYAYEMVHQTYLLGKHIIESLGLEDKIILIHDKFFKSMGPADALIIHEIIGGAIWDETLMCLNGTEDSRKVIPHIFSADIYAMQKPDNIHFEKFHPNDDTKFDPGVDLSDEYTNKIQNLVDDFYESRTKKFQYYYNFPYLGNTYDWNVVGSYSCDINKDDISDNITVPLDVSGKNIVIFPEYAMHNFKLHEPSHWRMNKACLIADLPKGSEFVQNTGTGIWWIKCP